MSLELEVASDKSSMQLEFKLAESYSEIAECKSLIAHAYFDRFGIQFSNNNPDSTEKIELFPHRYLMGLVKDEVIAVMGLYLHSTNPERYANVTVQDIYKLLVEAGLESKYSGKNNRELSKFVVKDKWQNYGVGKYLIGVSHSKNFIHFDGNLDSLILSCANQSIYKKFIDPLGIQTRLIRAMPFNKILEWYFSENELMECRLTIPDIDIPPYWYNFKLPGKIQIANRLC